MSDGGSKSACIFLPEERYDAMIEVLHELANFMGERKW